MTKRTWLFVDSAAMFGGHEVMLLRWIEELLQQQDAVGVRAKLMARGGSRLQDLTPAPARSDALLFPAERGGGLLSGLRNLWRDAAALRRALKRERPEWVVFASGYLGFQMPLVLLARLWGARVLVYVPMLDTFESMGFKAGWLKDRFVRWFYAQVPQGWVAITAEQAAQFRAWARPDGAIHLLPNTVARDIESAPRLAPRPLAADERLRVLVLGRIDAKQKGLDLLLDALEAAPASTRDRLLVSLIGEGPYRAIVESRIAANPALAPCLALGDWMAPREALAAHDVLLLPSRYEGVPLVMLEAMALGLPVVGADLPGIRAHIGPHQLFPVGDIARAFEPLDALRDRDDRAHVAEQGRAAYEAGASSVAFAAAVAALVTSVRATEAVVNEPALAAVTSLHPGNASHPSEN